MTIKYNGKDLTKRIAYGKEVQKVMYNGSQIWPSETPVGVNYFYVKPLADRVTSYSIITPHLSIIATF